MTFTQQFSLQLSMGSDHIFWIFQRNLHKFRCGRFVFADGWCNFGAVYCNVHASPGIP